jgi:ABC-type phosphate transport system substrate-binding protein
MRRPPKLFLLLPAALAVLAPAWRVGSSSPRPGSTHAVSIVPAQQRALAVIVHRSNPTEDLSTAELREYFLAERTNWPTKQKVRAVMIAPGRPERQALLQLALDMRREQDYQAHFLRAKFTEQAVEQPRELSAPADVLRFVSNVPGALAYLPASEVDPSVKVLRVDGLAPGDPGYRLRF